MNKALINDILTFQTELGLEEEELKDLYGNLMEELREIRKELRQTFARGDSQQFFKAIHNLKGVAGSYRLFPVFDQARKIDAGKSQGLSALSLEDYASLDKALDEAFGTMEEMFL